MSTNSVYIRSVDWPSLMAFAERHGFPVGRVDRLGNLHTLRTVDDLDDGAALSVASEPANDAHAV